MLFPSLFCLHGSDVITRRKEKGEKDGDRLDLGTLGVFLPVVVVTAAVGTTFGFPCAVFLEVCSKVARFLYPHQVVCSEVR